MDFKKYNILRQRANKSYEGTNGSFDKLLYSFSYVGNVSAIFFAYFLIYPALLKTISINFIQGFGSVLISFTFTLLFLTMFEFTKRYLIRIFSKDFILNKKKIDLSVLNYFILSLVIVIFSFYMSIAGAAKLAITSTSKNATIENNVKIQNDSLTTLYDKKKQVYSDDNETLRKASNNLRQDLTVIPFNKMNTRREYQSNIDKNTQTISDNQNEISKIDVELKTKITEIAGISNNSKTDNQSDDNRNILIFVIIVIFNELIIIVGIYFRENYEHKLYLSNQKEYEPLYQRKVNYKSLLAFVYNNGKLSTNEKVMNISELKKIVTEKTVLKSKFVDEFIRDMERMGIFSMVGNKRMTNLNYSCALGVLEDFDDIYKNLESIK